MNAPTPPAQIDAAGASPVMAQFFEAKARQPDALVFFRMGDFYELFFEDAKQAAAALGITLTARGQHGGQPIPMAGVPVHAAEAYLAKLIRAGFKVAVCEQMEDPAEAKKRGSKSVVRRDLVRVVTPGTLTEDGLLDARGANRLAAVAVRAGQAAVASVELSTGEVECLAVSRDGLGSALAALAPSEILTPDRLFSDEVVGQALKAGGGFVQPMPQALAEPSASEARLKRLYGVDTLDGFGQLSGAEVAALGLIAAHLETTQAGRLPALSPPRRAGEADVMSIDPATRASLEIEKTLSGGRDGSLLAAIDRTVTAPACSRPGWRGRCWTRRRSTPGWTPSPGSSTTGRCATSCAKPCAAWATWPERCRGWRWAGAGRGTWAACATASPRARRSPPCSPPRPTLCWRFQPSSHRRCARWIPPPSPASPNWGR